MDESEHDRLADEPPRPGPGHAPPAGAPAPHLAPERRTATSLLTWGTVALVLVIVIVLIVIKLTGTSPTATTSSGPPTQPAAAAVVAAATKVPASVFDAVGVTSAAATVSAPQMLHGQPPLRFDGKPGVLFVGNEFCPYCAAERWALVVALARFGTFRGLDAGASAANEVFAGTPTFSFAGTAYESRYVSARLVEHYGSQKNAAGTAYSVLTPLTREDEQLLRRYGDPTSAGTGPLVPFLDVANTAVSAGGLFSPSIFQQLTATKIAAGLVDAKDPATQAVVAAANYISAAICDADGGRPAKVCTSKGVTAAQAAMTGG